MPDIKKITAREILNSTGLPTIETTVHMYKDRVISSVPSGASISQYEAVELRDGDKARYLGKGVLKAIEKINNLIGPKLAGFDPIKQTKVDQALIDLDGKADKSNLGANTILSVSQAVLKAGALSVKMPLYKYIAIKYDLAGKKINIPTPIFSFINGGLHGAGNLDFQEFHLIPTSKRTYSQSLSLASEIYQTLKKVLIHRNAIHSIGDDGGFAPNLFTNADALEVISEAVAHTKYRLGNEVFFGLDAAASFFHKFGKYSIKDSSHPMGPAELIGYYKELKGEYHILYLEDPLWEDDWKSWQTLTKEIGESTLIVGDDLLCTNKKRVLKAINKKACTSILVRPNQVGTISEAVEVAKIAKDKGYKVVVSHRSGETNDNFIADFSVGIGADYTKFGAPVRGERVAKYNRLLTIEDEIKKT
jgi:enolase